MPVQETKRYIVSYRGGEITSTIDTTSPEEAMGEIPTRGTVSMRLTHLNSGQI